MKKVPWWNINLNCQKLTESSKECIQSRSFSMGEFTKEFERKLSELTGFKYIFFTTSGSSALLMASIAADIKPGDLVYVPNRTWIATAHAPYLLGAQIKIIDTEKERPVLDIAQLANCNEKPKAIYPTSLNGNYVDVVSLKRIFKDSVIIEDCAQSLMSLSEKKQIGLKSDIACFSLGMAKFLPVGQGGFVATNNEKLAFKLSLIRSHGVETVEDRTPFSMRGFNFRPTDLTASLGLAQIEDLNSRRLSFINLWCNYKNILKDYSFINLTPVNIDKGEMPLYIEVTSPYRDEIVSSLQKVGIETRKVYPDLDTANYLKNGYKNNSLANSRLFGRESFVLPSGPNRDAVEFEFISKSLKSILNQI